MATSAGRSRCVKCDKDKATLRCGGCLQEFCYKHIADHRQELNKQLDEVEVNRDLFRQTLTEQTTDPQQNTLIQQINDWERDSIIKIRETAEEARQTLIKHTTGHTRKVEIDLNKLTDQLRESREEDDFFETDLQHWDKELTRLTEELAKPSNVNVQHNTASLISKISVDITSVSSCSTKIDANAKWIQTGITVVGGNGQGNGLNQLYQPVGLYIDDDQTVYVADQSNHRIVEWKSRATSGQVVAGGNGQGNRNDQLNNSIDVIVDKESDSLIICDYGNQRVVRWPRRNGTSGETIISDINCWGLVMDNDEYLYVPDYSKHEVRRWKVGDTNGTVVAGGAGAGNRLDQLNRPTYIFVDQDHSVYVSDTYNNRVMKWIKGAKVGIIVAGGQGQGNGVTQLSLPYGVIVDQLSTVYVADYSNHRVMRWPKGATQGSVVVGGNGPGAGRNQLSCPIGLSFDRQGNLYVSNQTSHRVLKFNIDPNSNT